MRPAAHQSGLRLNPLPGITTRWWWDKGESWLADDEEVRPLAGGRQWTATKAGRGFDCLATKPGVSTCSRQGTKVAFSSQYSRQQAIKNPAGAGFVDTVTWPYGLVAGAVA